MREMRRMKEKGWIAGEKGGKWVRHGQMLHRTRRQHWRRYTTDWIVLLSTEDHRTCRHLLLRGACWEMLSRTERSWQTVGRHWRNCIRYRHSTLRELFVEVHHHGALLRRVQ